MKIIFKKASLKNTVEIIRNFYFEDEVEVHETKKYLFEYFTELKKIDPDMTIEEKNNYIYNIVKKEYDFLSEKMDKQVFHFNQLWEKYNDDFIKTLSNYLNTSWHESKNEIIGYVAPTPIFPRFPDNLSFYIHPNINDEKLIEVTAHECTHFLWFKKISEINNKPYNEYTHDEWEYSELVVDPILNSNEMHKILNIDEKAYPYFYKQIYNKEKIMDHIKKIYISDKSIEEKIKEGFNYYLEYKKRKKQR